MIVSNSHYSSKKNNDKIKNINSSSIIRRELDFVGLKKKRFWSWKI